MGKQTHLVLHLYLLGCTDLKFYNNTAYNNTNGFAVTALCTLTTFEGNNITNATNYGIWVADNISADYSSSASLIFSGNNGIYNTPSTGYEIYIHNSTISTNGYNITTSNMTFALNTTANVSIKSVDLNALGLTTVTTITDNATSSEISIDSAKIVQNSHGNYYGLNVTNTSASATFTPKLYYNNSDLGSYSSAYLGMGESSTAGSWTYYTPTTLNETEYSIYETGLASFSYFAPLVYTSASPSITTASSGLSTYDVAVSHVFNCTTGSVDITVLSRGVAAVGVPVTFTDFTNPQSGTTDSEGKVSFTISRSGEYVLFTRAISHYRPSKSDFTFILCPTELIPEPVPPVVEPVLPGPECTSNTNCGDSQYCSSDGHCLPLQGTCGYAANHSWVNYGCCTDSDCGADKTCIAHVCTEKVQNKNETPPVQPQNQTIIQPPTPPLPPLQKFDWVLASSSLILGIVIGALGTYLIMARRRTN